MNSFMNMPTQTLSASKVVVGTLVAKNLLPNKRLATDGVGQLVSSDIQIPDVVELQSTISGMTDDITELQEQIGSVITNPLQSALDAGDYNISNVNRLNVRDIKSNYESAITQIGLRENDLILVSDDITLNSTTLKHSILEYNDPRNILTTPLREGIDAANNNITNVHNITTDEISGPDNSTQIFMNMDNISIFTPNELKHNNRNILTTLLQEEVDANSNNIINVDRMTVSSIADSTENRVIDFATAGEIQVYASARTTFNSAEVLLNSIKDIDTSASSIDFTTPNEISLSAPDCIKIISQDIILDGDEVKLPQQPSAKRLKTNAMNSIIAEDITIPEIVDLESTITAVNNSTLPLWGTGARSTWQQTAGFQGVYDNAFTIGIEITTGPRKGRQLVASIWGQFGRCLYTDDGGVSYGYSTGTPATGGTLGYNGTILLFITAVGDVYVSTDDGDSFSFLGSAGLGFTFITQPIYWDARLGLFISSWDSQGTIATSPNGITWTARPSATREVRAIMITPTAIVTTGLNGVMTSVDGVTWVNGVSTPMLTGAYALQLDRVAGFDSADGRVVHVSDDRGVTWTTLSDRSTAMKPYRAVTWVPSAGGFLLAQVGNISGSNNFFIWSGRSADVFVGGQPLGLNGMIENIGTEIYGIHHNTTWGATWVGYNVEFNGGWYARDNGPTPTQSQIATSGSLIAKDLYLSGQTNVNNIATALGTVSSPAYSFAGDSNTGIWSAGADQIGFTTGGTNKMSITSNDIKLDTTDILQNGITRILPSKIGSNNLQIFTELPSVSYNNTHIGYVAGGDGTNLNTGSSNTSIGALSNVLNTTGNSNTFIGCQSGLLNESGSNNTCIGVLSGKSIVSNGGNVCIGWNADVTTCNASIAIGTNATLPADSNNSIVIGSSLTGESSAFTYGGSGNRFQNVGDGTADLGASNHRFRDLYLGRNMIVNGNTMTAVGGVWMQLTAGTEIHTTTTETSLLAGSTALGSLVVGANTATQSAFQLVLYGTFGAVSTHDLTIKVNMGTTTIATLFMQDLVAVSGEHFEIECDYSITDLTSPTIASITTNLEFSYSSTGTASFVGDRTVNMTTFDSTSSNTLSVTAKWGSASGSDRIQCLRGTLKRIY